MSISDLVKNLLKDFAHGGAFKAFALLARISFLIYVLPGLPDGELTAYVYINSVALLFATFCIFGLNDELPRVIGGDRYLARRYASAFLGLSFLACLTLGILWSNPETFWAIGAYGLSVLASRFLGGLIRSFDPALNEQLQNLPWVIFFPLALWLGSDSAFELIGLMVVSQILVQCYCAGRALAKAHEGDSGAEQAAAPLFSMLRQSLRHGVGKQLSNLCLLGMMRSPVLWPVWLGLEADIDGVAFAVAAGEVVAQFGLIPVNRAYSNWCRVVPRDAHEWRRAVYMGLTWWAMLSTAGGIAIVAAGLLGLLPAYQYIELLLLQAILLYAFVPVFRLIRYLVWARDLLAVPVALVSAALFLLAGLVIATTPLTQWLLGLFLICAAGWALLAVLSKPSFPAALRPAR